MTTLKLRVRGMSCGHCVRAVEEAVRAAAPGARVTVSLEEGLVTVEASDGLDRTRIERAIVEAGYEVEGSAA